MFDPELKAQVKTLERGSWYEQDKLLESFPFPEKDNNQTSCGSASHKKILDEYEYEFETKSDENLYSSNDEAV